MPSRRVHLKFDEYLIDHGIVSDRDYSIVHDRMDRDIQIHGHWNHRYEDYYHDINGIRDWIRKWCHLGYQETLSDYVEWLWDTWFWTRCGLSTSMKMNMN